MSSPTPTPTPTGGGREEEPKIKETHFNCECGSKVTLGNKSTHLKSKKHRRFMGETGPEVEIIRNYKVGRILPKRPPHPDSLSFVLNNRVEVLNEEQKQRRRDYFRGRVQLCRANKKKNKE